MKVMLMSFFGYGSFEVRVAAFCCVAVGYGAIRLGLLLFVVLLYEWLVFGCSCSQGRQEGHRFAI